MSRSSAPRSSTLLLIALLVAGLASFRLLSKTPEIPPLPEPKDSLLSRIRFEKDEKRTSGQILIEATQKDQRELVLADAKVDESKPAAAKDWTLFRGNALMTGVAPEALPEKLEILWQFKTKDSVENAAAIVGDTVYVGSNDEHLYALNLRTGEERWRYKAGPFRAPASVFEGKVYIGDADGKFHCVDARSGAKRWVYDTEAEIVSGANFVGDSILFGAADETLYCLTTTGKERWKFKVAGGPVLGTPAVVGGRTFVAGCDSNLHVIDITKGTEISKVELEGQTAATPAIDGDYLYLGTMTNQVLGIDWKKSQVAWKFEVPKGSQPFFASAAVADDRVVAASRDKRVYGLDRKSGSEVWRFNTRNKVEASPVIAGKRVYVGSTDGNLYVLDLAKGTELAKYPLGRQIVASPAIASGCLVISNSDGVVYCLGSKK